MEPANFLQAITALATPSNHTVKDGGKLDDLGLRVLLDAPIRPVPARRLKVQRRKETDERRVVGPGGNSPLCSSSRRFFYGLHKGYCHSKTIQRKLTDMHVLNIHRMQTDASSSKIYKIAGNQHFYIVLKNPDEIDAIPALEIEYIRWGSNEHANGFVDDPHNLLVFF